MTYIWRNVFSYIRRNDKSKSKKHSEMFPTHEVQKLTCDRFRLNYQLCIMYEKSFLQIYVIPQDFLTKEFDKKIYSLKVAHPATTISSRYQAWYLTQVVLTTKK